MSKNWSPRLKDGARISRWLDPGETPPFADRRPHRGSKPEEADHLGKLGGLTLEALRGRGTFFDKRGVLRGDLVKLADGVVELANARALLLARCRDLRYELVW